MRRRSSHRRPAAAGFNYRDAISLLRPAVAERIAAAKSAQATVDVAVDTTVDAAVDAGEKTTSRQAPPQPVATGLRPYRPDPGEAGRLLRRRQPAVQLGDALVHLIKPERNTK